MDKTNKSTAHFQETFLHVCAVIAAHPAVKEVGKPDFCDDMVRLTVIIEVPFPNAWKAQGKSPHGVRRLEEARLDFPSNFPLDPPEISLRQDFSRHLAHVQPWLTEDNRPVPCIQYGQMSEFLFQEGIRGIINQTVLWLEHAAEGKLIDENQGWEPVRRDKISDYIVADENELKNHVDRRGGFQFLQYEYLRNLNQEDGGFVYGKISNKRLPLNKKTAKENFTQIPINANGETFFGTGMALIVWPGKLPSGKPIICDEYAPENVTNLASLKSRATMFGCRKELSEGLSRIKICVKDYRFPRPLNLAIVLCVRRPFNLIDTATPIELCMYFVDFCAGNAFPDKDSTPVKIAGHRHQISPSLLALLSGLDTWDKKENVLPWSLIGAGSLGSKIALHMARAGRAPISVTDRSGISPHNAARHALIPPVDSMQLDFIGNKAKLLSDAIKGFAQITAPLDHDVIDVIHAPALAKQAWPKGTKVIVNTTASLRVRAALNAVGGNLKARIIESILYGKGRLGLIATEGSDHNPNLADLFTHFYAHCKVNETYQEILFGKNDIDLERTTIGQGCGSSTMRMSDGRVSLFSAATSEYLLSKHDDSFPGESGELMIGITDKKGLGVSWQQIQIPPCTIIQCVNNANWTVHISSDVVEKIGKEVSQWPNAETGGVILGRQEEVSKSFHIIDVLPAPSDSIRTPYEFVLGQSGLRKKINEYSDTTNWALYCLGTWHSHLNPSEPSRLDYNTAQTVGLARLAPSVLLIHTPEGFHAVLADNHLANKGAL